MPFVKQASVVSGAAGQKGHERHYAQRGSAVSGAMCLLRCRSNLDVVKAVAFGPGP